MKTEPSPLVGQGFNVFRVIEIEGAVTYDPDPDFFGASGPTYPFPEKERGFCGFSLLQEKGWSLRSFRTRAIDKILSRSRRDSAFGQSVHQRFCFTGFRRWNEPQVTLHDAKILILWGYFPQQVSRNIVQRHFSVCFRGEPRRHN